MLTGTHVYLYPKSTDLEAKMHNIPLKIKDKGEPPLERNLNLQGTANTEFVLLVQMMVIFTDSYMDVLKYLTNIMIYFCPQ